MTRYFSRVDSDPESGTYQSPMSLHRRADLPARTILERFDRTTGWIDHPSLLDQTGMGGADDYAEISRDEAVGLLVSWGMTQEEAERAIADSW